MRILGLDPGLRHTGWGILDIDGSHLRHVADGRVDTSEKDDLSVRLLALQDGLAEIIDFHRPDTAAIEETFVNKNPTSTLKLGMARGVVMLAPARAGLAVTEYGANHIKKSVVGVGHADKVQVQTMVARLLPGIAISSADAADALAVAICHAHHSQTSARVRGQPIRASA